MIQTREPPTFDTSSYRDVVQQTFDIRINTCRLCFADRMVLSLRRWVFIRRSNRRDIASKPSTWVQALYTNGCKSLGAFVFFII